MRELSRWYVFPLSAWCTGAGDDAQTLDELALRLSAKEREILPLQAELAHLFISNYVSNGADNRVYEDRADVYVVARSWPPRRNTQWAHRPAFAL